MNADGSGQTNITNNPAEDILPSWQAGGLKIAFQTNRDGDTEIYTVNPDGTGLMNVSNGPASFDGEPDWSPDGSRIAFATNQDAIGFGVDIYVMDAIGGGVTGLTNSHTDSMRSAYSRATGSGVTLDGGTVTAASSRSLVRG